MACCVVGAFLFIGISSVVGFCRKKWARLLGAKEPDCISGSEWSLKQGDG
jgi:hypothetical protein